MDEREGEAGKGGDCHETRRERGPSLTHFEVLAVLDHIAQSR